ncbi:MAG TPA: chemotaxis protein CheW [Pseudomonadales bacterium]
MKKHSEADNARELILFTLAERVLAIDTECLIEVLEPVTVTPLPFVPDYVDGLINVSGQIMPQINTGLLVLGQHSKQHLSTLLVVQIDGVPLALCVNQVLEPVTVAASAIAPARKNSKKTATATVEAAYLAGVFAHRQQEVWLLDSSRLKSVIKAQKKAAGTPGFLGEVSKKQLDAAEIHHDFLIVTVAGKEYALALQDIEEIVELTSLTSQPRAPAEVAGISLVRGQPRLVLYLAVLLGLDADAGFGQTIIMVKAGASLCGLLIDSLTGMESIADSAIRYSRDKKKRSLLRDNGKRVTPVLKPELLLNEQILASIQAYLPGKLTSMERIVPTVEFLRFSINGDLYGFAIDHIQRVVTDKHIEPLLSPHAYILGTTEIEGKVVPVIDLIAQLGYNSHRDQLAEFIVVNDGSNDWALAIYHSDQMAPIEETRIDWLDKHNARYVAAFANDDDRLLTVLNVQKICQDNNQRQAV